jgi:hypothetical protein
MKSTTRYAIPRRPPWDLLRYTVTMSEFSLPWKVYRQHGRVHALIGSYATQDPAQEYVVFMNRQLSRHHDLDRVRYVVAFEPSTGEFTASGLLPPDYE